MIDIFEKIDTLLGEAEKAATLENSSFGFPNDRIEVKSVHFGDDRTGRVGDVLHPDEYIKNITRLHHNSWIIQPIKNARVLLAIHAELLRECNRLVESLGELETFGNIQQLLDRAKSGLSN